MTPAPDATSPASQVGGLSCRCGRPYASGPDLVVPDDVWAKISPTGDEGGILCPNCIHDALVASGFEDGTVRAAFTSGPMADPSYRKDAVQSGAVAWPTITDAWVDTYCELTGREPTGAQVTFLDGGVVTTFREVAKREIEAMLCAAPKSAVRSLAAPQSEPLPGGVGEREKVDLAVRAFFTDHTGFLPSPDGTEAEAYYGSWVNIPIGKLTDAILAALSGKEQG